MEQKPLHFEAGSQSELGYRAVTFSCFPIGMQKHSDTLCAPVPTRGHAWRAYKSTVAFGVRGGRGANERRMAHGVMRGRTDSPMAQNTETPGLRFLQNVFNLPDLET